jgi:hypothetical protein
MKLGPIWLGAGKFSAIMLISLKMFCLGMLNIPRPLAFKDMDIHTLQKANPMSK